MLLLFELSQILSERRLSNRLRTAHPTRQCNNPQNHHRKPRQFISHSLTRLQKRLNPLLIQHIKYLNILTMKDVALDDLIKEDKEKKKLQHKKKAHAQGDKKGRRLIRKGEKPGRRDERQDNRGPGGKKPFNKGRDAPNTGKFNKFNKNRDDRQKEDRPKKENKNKPEKKQQQTQKPEGPIQQRGRTLKVLGLHPDVTNEDLYKLFAAEGALQKCMIEQDNFGRNLPSAIAKYYSAESAKKAIENINNKKVMNSVLTVEPYRYVKK